MRGRISMLPQRLLGVFTQCDDSIFAVILSSNNKGHSVRQFEFVDRSTRFCVDHATADAKRHRKLNDHGVFGRIAFGLDRSRLIGANHFHDDVAEWSIGPLDCRRRQE